MKKRWLPIPLVLLTPIVLLVLVIAAGVYRFSLSDEEILAKFPVQSAQADAIVEQLFGLKVTTPLTIPVPEAASFALIDRWDGQHRWVMGNYDSGSERGQVLLDTHSLLALKGQEKRYGYAGIIRVSNQGSGVMNYLALFQYDELRLRMVMVDSQCWEIAWRYNPLRKTTPSLTFLCSHAARMRRLQIHPQNLCL